MNKKEFLNELENALAGKLPESDIVEILTDYGDIFHNGVAEGKSEDEIAGEIGSPAKVARTILEDGIDAAGRARSEEKKSGSASDGREYTDFQKNINEKTSRIFDKVIEPDRNVQIETLAPMSRRLGAYVIDSILLGVVGIGVLVALFIPVLGLINYTSDIHYVTSGALPPGMEIAKAAGPMFGFRTANIILLMTLFGAFNLFTTIILWATNGYTPGKYILKMRVVKINGSRIGFLDALLRELVIKCIANSLLSGLLNLGSFIWGCMTDDHKTVHDLVAQTRVVEWGRTAR